MISFIEKNIKLNFDISSLILIIVNILLNAISLFIVILIPASYITNKGYLVILISLGIPIFLTLLGLSSEFQELIARITITNQREIYSEEKNLLYPLIVNVINRINNNYNLNLEVVNFNIKVFNDESINVFALGSRNLYVSEGFLYDNLLTSDEREAVLAHEFGHLIKKDSVFMSSVISCNFIIRVLGYACSLIIALNKKPRIRTNKSGGIWILLVFAFYIIFVKILSDRIFKLILMFKSRKVEYRCDAFSASLGYKESLKSFFKKLEKTEINSNINFIKQLYSTHPKTSDRILALENNYL